MIRNWIKGSGVYKISENTIAQQEIFVNGGFDTDTWWSKDTGCTIIDGVGRFTNTTAGHSFYRSNALLIVGKTYKITYTIKNYVSGSFRIIVGGTTAPVGSIRTANGIYTDTLTAGVNASLYLMAIATGTTLDIDDVSVVEVQPLPTITTGTKYLENTTSGTAAIQSKTAYGEWEFDVYKSAFINNTIVGFIQQYIGVENGYRFRLSSSDGVIRFQKDTGSILITANSYISNNTWYRVKIARLKSAGVFKDIPTLQVSAFSNSEGGAKPYPTFTSNGRYGFSATSNGSDIAIAGTADEISIVNGAKYIVEFDLKLNSGTAPDIALKANTGLTGNISNTVTTTNGRNSIILTSTTTTTGALGFYNSSTATNFTVSGLTIRRIYDANSFAVFIKGGAYGNTETGWTLVDTTGGLGSNPIVDSTYTTSNYFVADLYTGDRLANLKIMDGVKQ